MYSVGKYTSINIFERGQNITATFWTGVWIHPSGQCHASPLLVIMKLTAWYYYSQNELSSLAWSWTSACDSNASIHQTFLNYTSFMFLPFTSAYFISLTFPSVIYSLHMKFLFLLYLIWYFNIPNVL